MNKNSKNKIQLTLTGMIQVMLVAINTYQIANKHYLGAIICGFLISFVWSFNIKKIAFGTIWDRLVYCTGAALGTGISFIIVNYLYGK